MFTAVAGVASDSRKHKTGRWEGSGMNGSASSGGYFAAAARAPGAAPERPRVLIAEPNPGVRSRLRGDFEQFGWLVSETANQDETRAAYVHLPPQLAVIELRLEDGFCFPLITLGTEVGAVVVVLTAHGSVAAAISAIKHGATAFLCKPVGVARILIAAGGGRVEPALGPPPPMTLCRARWEYLSRAVVTEGSVTGASRRLGLQARSLRRMLAKAAP
jgi:two-component system response regulator RegA